MAGGKIKSKASINLAEIVAILSKRLILSAKQWGIFAERRGNLGGVRDESVDEVNI